MNLYSYNSEQYLLLTVLGSMSMQIRANEFQFSTYFVIPTARSRHFRIKVVSNSLEDGEDVFIQASFYI
jgi:hypothetical protein